MKVEFCIPGPVVPKGRPRFGRGHSFTPRRTVIYERLVKACAVSAMAGRLPLALPVEVEVVVYMPDKKRRDLDNCIKSVTDACNEVVYLDDVQIVRLRASKEVDREHPRVLVSVQEAA